MESAISDIRQLPPHTKIRESFPHSLIFSCQLLFLPKLKIQHTSKEKEESELRVIRQDYLLNLKI